MQITIYLKKLLVGFIEVYQKYFLKTIRSAFLWTVLCFLIAAIIAGFSDFDLPLRSKPISILSYFFSRFSYKDYYNFGDIVKSIFLFFVSIFSINLIRNGEDDDQSKRSPKKVTLKNIFSLLATLVTCILLDCALFRLEGQLKHGIDNIHLAIWVSNMIFFLRIFLPLVLFALVIQISTSKAAFTINKILFLFIAVWFFNELAYEVTIFVRGHVFELILFPTNQTWYYWLESILGAGLISVYFLGYYYAMTAPFKLSEVKETTEDQKSLNKLWGKIEMDDKANY
jgi:hypothetical protein